MLVLFSIAGSLRSGHCRKGMPDDDVTLASLSEGKLADLKAPQRVATLFSCRNGAFSLTVLSTASSRDSMRHVCLRAVSADEQRTRHDDSSHVNASALLQTMSLHPSGLLLCMLATLLFVGLTCGSIVAFGVRICCQVRETSREKPLSADIFEVAR